MVVGAAHGCAGSEETPPDKLCDPGENIFCRCPGGDPGTKECLETGNAFGECSPCEERPTSGPGAQSSSSGGPSSSSGAGAGDAGGMAQGGGGPTGDAALLAPCQVDGDCQSGRCDHSYCTKACAVVSDCPYPQSECVPFGDDAICMPTCTTAVDCSPFGAPQSQCGFTQAIDNWDVTVCADWGDAHQLMPVNTDCLPFDHTACNLGYPHSELVCTEQGICANGCYINNDCPSGEACSGGSTLGTCQ